MRTSSSARLKKIASLGTAGFMVLAMSGVAVTAAQADTTAEPPAETVPPDSGDDEGHEGGDEGHEGGDEGHAGGGGQGGNHEGGGGQGGNHEGGGGQGGNHDGEEPPDDGDDGDDHGDDGDDHGGGKGKGKGNPPDPVVVQTPTEGDLDCELGVPVQIETVTTVYEWVKGKWVLSDESTTELSDVEYRPLTEAEVAEYCVTEEELPPDEDDEVAGVDKSVRTPVEKPAAAKAPQAAAEVEVLGVEAEAPTQLPTEVSAGLGETPAGSPLGSGMVAGGLGLLALAGIMAKRRPVLDEGRR